MLNLLPDSIRTLALLRLSAIGDVTLTAGIIPALQAHFTDTQFIWITTPECHNLLSSLVTNVEFILIDKPKSLRAWWQAKRKLQHLQPDVLLAMQASLSANCLYPLINAPIKLGFDRQRARDGHRHFITHHIPSQEEHLMDGFLSFAKMLGVKAPQAAWPTPSCDEHQAWLNLTLPPTQTWVCLHPVASKQERTWSWNYYVDLAQQVIQTLHANIVITGGSTPSEVAFNQIIADHLPGTCVNLTGQTNLPQLRSLLAHVNALVAPDTAAVHIARSVNTPVVGLYAVADPSLSGPYQADQYCINRYPDAIKHFLPDTSHPPSLHTRVHHPKAMDLVTVNDVLLKLHHIIKETT